MRISDWSSDVCSSDLAEHVVLARCAWQRGGHRRAEGDAGGADQNRMILHIAAAAAPVVSCPTARFVTELAGPLAEIGGTLAKDFARRARARSEEHTSETQSLMRISFAVFCLEQKK